MIDHALGLADRQRLCHAQRVHGTGDAITVGWRVIGVAGAEKDFKTARLVLTRGDEKSRFSDSDGT
jgi:hypothetical protein